MEKKKSKGLGDTIEKITEATGIKKAVHFLFGEDCGCEERKEKLNKLFPYNKIECLTEEEYEYLSRFGWNDPELRMSDGIRLLKIYNRVFNDKRKIGRCADCWREIIRKLKDVYNQYEKEKE